VTASYGLQYGVWQLAFYPRFWFSPITLLSRSWSRTPVASNSFRFKTTKLGPCARRGKHPFGLPKRITLSTDRSRDNEDRSNFQDLSLDEQHFISHVLNFFAAADGIVNENLLLNFASAVQSLEARCFYGLQILMENVHAETYSLLIATLIPGVSGQTRLFKAIKTLLPCVRRKAD
jgi:hypothetical protein